MERKTIVPARMVNEFVYCPRLCHIEWVQGDFKESVDTAEGHYSHRRVDVKKGAVPNDTEVEEKIHSTSVDIGSEELGAIAKIDLLEGENGIVRPVDYKKGTSPKIPEKVYLPERVQLCVQGLLLRENGYQCDEGIIYFVGSKQRVTIAFDDELVAITKEAINSTRGLWDLEEQPPPLVDSSKCYRCSLAGLCLPDETNRLALGNGEVRRLFPARDDLVPVYVIGEGHVVKKHEGRLEVWKEGHKIAEVPLHDLSQLSLFGNSSITVPAMAELMDRGIPICYFSHGGWFNGYAIGTSNKNVHLRIKQYQTGLDKEKAVRFARQFIYGKIKNSRTLLRRNDKECPDSILKGMDAMADSALECGNLDSLLGIEGNAAQMYFSRFRNLLKTDGLFDFNGRNKRPPTDPVNSVLSYLYGILTKDVFNSLLMVGFDPYMGLFHQPKHGKPALALDLMEEFRPLIADSVAITLFNNEELKDRDFIKTSLGINMTPLARKAVVKAYERRINSEVTHPIFGYTISYRRVLEVQARLLGRAMAGEIPEYPPLMTR